MQEQKQERNQIDEHRQHDVEVKQTTGPEGLAGFYGLTFVNERVQYQFRILRPMTKGRWVVQYYSFWTGAPNKLGVYSEKFLLGGDCAFFPDVETWRTGYDEASQRTAHEAHLNQEQDTREEGKQHEPI